MENYCGSFGGYRYHYVTNQPDVMSLYIEVTIEKDYNNPLQHFQIIKTSSSSLKLAVTE